MNTNENVKKKSFSKAIIIVVVLVVIVLGVGFAYARYITKLNGNATADIAKWSLKINGSTNQNFIIDLAQTRTGVTQEAEVEGNYIAPGTAGAFEIELDATGSEASLEYDINLNVNYANNTVFPKNLIFYSDSNMRNAIYHDDTSININGFIGWNDNSQVQTKTIYWKWDYETGSTQNEINANDELDSYWIGRPISISMNVTAKQVSENPTTGQYAVTFDANGGTLQDYGNASKATKMVTYGENYGPLPTPTRAGYTFKGWNGKNLLNLNVSESIPNNRLFPNTEQRTFITYTYIKGLSPNNYYAPARIRYCDIVSNSIELESRSGYGIAYALLCKENTTYTLSCDVNKENSGSMGSAITFYNEEGSVLNSYQRTLNESGHISFSITSQFSAYYMLINFFQPNDDIERISFTNIQLEEGSTATAYEPYYITPSTEVVQNHNHTLTAIWEEE